MEFVFADAMRGLAGGLLIGIASALLLLMNGRIAGISGIAAVLVGEGERNGRSENFAFLAALIVAPLVYAMLVARPEIGITSNPLLLITAGVFVGVGTRLGNGCTSGHGVCGMSRFSVRSISSVLTFVGIGMAVASLISLWIEVAE